jgi:hypothetical protein
VGRRHPLDAGFLTGAALSAVLYAWIGGGGFPLATRTGSREHYYTVAALALLHGRLYVPYKTLMFECFEVHHRCYGYFGLAPSLLRLPVAILLGAGAKNNGVEFFYFLLGFVVAAVGAWWITRQLVALWAPRLSGRALGRTGLLSAAAVLGATPLLFLMGRPLVYEEAILWGVAFASVGLGAAIAFRLRPRLRTLIALLAADTLGVLSRPTSGASAIFATVVLGAWLLYEARRRRRGAGDGIPGVPHPVAWGLVLIVGAGVAFASASVVAYAKFHSFSPPYPDQVLLKHEAKLIAPFQHFAGVNAAVLPTKLVSDFDPTSLILLDHPPFIVMRELHPLVIWPARKADLVWEPTASVTDALPFCLVAALAGLWYLGAETRRWLRTPRPRPPNLRLEATVLATLSALGALVLGLAFPGFTYRYLDDWLPLLTIGVAVGMAGFLDRQGRSRRRFAAVAVVAVLLLGAQLFVQTSLAVQNGLTSTGRYAAVCHGKKLDPYGFLGAVFCSGRYSARM